MSLPNDDNDINELNDALNEVLSSDDINNASSDNGLQKKSKNHKRIIKRILRGLLIFVGSVLVILVITFIILYQKGRISFFNNGDKKIVVPTNESVVTQDNGKYIYYNNEAYEFNPNVTSILCLGVDKSKLGTEYGVIGTGGQADAVFLVSIDIKNAKYTVISISRDSLVDVNTYSKTGIYMGIEKTQLCLSFAYGDGKKTSCENTVKSVSRLLYGIPINTYFAVDIKAIGILVDKIGGIEVPEYNNKGEETGKTLKLTKYNAESYIRYRNVNILDSNNSRMKKHMNFLKAYSDKCIAKTKKNLNTPLNLFNSVSGYMSTTLDASRVTYLTTNIIKSGKKINIDYVSVGGTVKEGEDGFAEYNVDEDALFKLILNVFYTKVETK